jgi:hypothetical protein
MCSACSRLQATLAFVPERLPLPAARGRLRAVAGLGDDDPRSNGGSRRDARPNTPRDTRLRRCRLLQHGDRNASYYHRQRTTQLDPPSGLDARGLLAAGTPPPPRTLASMPSPSRPRSRTTTNYSTAVAPCPRAPGTPRTQTATHPSQAAPRSVSTRSRFPWRCAGLSDRVACRAAERGARACAQRRQHWAGVLLADEYSVPERSQPVTGRRPRGGDGFTRGWRGEIAHVGNTWTAWAPVGLRSGTTVLERRCAVAPYLD